MEPSITILSKDEGNSFQFDGHSAQSRALDRIREKRAQQRELELLQINEEIQKYQYDRNKFKNQIKKKTEMTVEKSVKKNIAMRAIHDYPLLFEHANKQILEKEWNKLVADIAATEVVEIDQPFKASSTLDVHNAQRESVDDSMMMTSFLHTTEYDITDHTKPITKSFLKRTVSISESQPNHPSPKKSTGILSKIINSEANNTMSPSSPHSETQQSAASPDSKLIDSLFIVGPTHSEVMSSIHHAIDSNASTSNVIMHSFISNPDLLYISCLDAMLDVEALPSLTFPSGVEVTISVSMSEPPPVRRLSNRQSNTRLNASDIGQTPIGQIPMKLGNTTRFVYVRSNNAFQQYVCCVSIPKIIFVTVNDRQVAVKTNYCICLITRYAFFSFYFNLLNEFVSMGGFNLENSSAILDKQLLGFPIQNELRQLEALALKLLRQSVPPQGQSLEISLSINYVRREVNMQRLSIQDLDLENCMGTLLWALPTLLKHIPLDQLILSIGCALTEMKIVIRSPNVELISACLMSLLHLIHPLQWAGPVIVILPNSWSDFLDSPVFIMLGMQAMPPSFVMTSGTIIIDPHQKLIHMHPTDVVSSHQLLLPNANKLMQQLKPQVDVIMKLCKKAKKSKRRSSDAVNIDHMSQSGASDLNSSADIVLPDTPSRRASMAALPSSMPSRARTPSVESQVTTTEEDFSVSPLLSAAIIKFATIMHEHIQKVVNTAIQLSWEDKKIRNQHNTDLKNAPRESTLRRTYSESSLGTESSQSDSPPPSLLPSSSYFPTNTLGASASAFMTKFRGTQMFSNYCQKNATSNDAIHNIFSADKASEHSENDEMKTFELESEDVEYRDPLVLLFSIMRHGTAPMRKTDLQRLSNVFNELYPENKVNHIVTADNITDSELMSQQQELWCNGRCNGKADTPLCTSICLQVWEHRVHEIHRQLDALGILDSTPELANCYAKLATGKTVPIKIRPEPPKHPNETTSQYIQRSAIVTGNAIDPSNPKLNKQSNKLRYVGQSSTQSSPSKKKKKSTTAVIADFYTRRNNKIRTKNKAKALLKIVMFIKRWYHSFRSRRRWRSAITIQAAYRAYVIRRDINTLVDELLYRKHQALVEKVALIKIQNWLRIVIFYWRGRKSKGKPTPAPEKIPFRPSKRFFASNLSSGSSLLSSLGVSESSLHTYNSRQLGRTGSLQSTYSDFSDHDTFPSITSSTISGLAQNPEPSNDKKVNPQKPIERSPSSIQKVFNFEKPEKRLSLGSNPDEDASKQRARASISPLSSMGANNKTSLRDVIEQRKKETEKTLRLSIDSLELLDAQPSSPARIDRRHSIDPSELPGLADKKVPSKQLNTASDDLDMFGRNKKNTKTELTTIVEENVKTPPRVTSPPIGLIELRPGEGIASTKGHARNMSTDSDLASSADSTDDTGYAAHPCIKLLGQSVIDVMTPQQMKAVIDMWEFLHKGIAIVKFNRNGTKHTRMLFCDSSFQTLYWREQEENTRGSMSSRRNSFMKFAKLDTERELFFHDIIDVVHDLNTEVMKKAIAKKKSGGMANIISILAANRTLDFQVDEAYWEPLYNGLKILAQTYQLLSAKIGARETLIDDSESKSDRSLRSFLSLK